MSSTGLDTGPGASSSSSLSSATKLTAVRAFSDQQIDKHLGTPSLSLNFNDRWFTTAEESGWGRNLCKAVNAEYNIVAPSETALRGAIGFGPDSLFASVPQALLRATATATASPVAASAVVYRFDQVDEAVWGPFRVYVFHGLDNGYFMRYPFVARDTASLSGRATADRFTEAVAYFVLGGLPWESFETSNRMMVVDESSSSLEKTELCRRWETLASTEERRKMFMNAGHLLVQYRPEMEQ
ncbi:hypothetical protein Sste5346_010244 [Sporothrix stenoceras]|uniref:Uncharacterized protein n=1 Tax=Sporothrix stenoceras TaxID=5173 RepID=A0ABR3YGW8_9PEZI